MEAKADYVVEHGLHGLQFWQLAGDTADHSLVLAAASKREDGSTEEPAPADFRFSVAAPGSLTVGDSGTVTVDIENVGEAAGSADYEIVVGGEVVDSGTVDLAGGEAASAAGEFTAEEAGEAPWGVTVDSETESGTIAVEESADEPEEEPLENAILIDGIGTSGTTEYEFVVSGSVEKSNYQGASINEANAIDGGRVTGSLTSWRDAYLYSGGLEDLSVKGEARVYVNGQQIDPAEYGGESTQVLTLVGNGNLSRYEITVDGAIELIEGEGATVSDGRAEGSIERGVQRFRLAGDLIDFTFLEGGTQAYLDSDRIDG